MNEITKFAVNSYICYLKLHVFGYHQVIIMVASADSICNTRQYVSFRPDIETGRSSEPCVCEIAGGGGVEGVKEATMRLMFKSHESWEHLPTSLSL